MKAVIQRVNSAELSVEGKLISKIGRGFVVYFCVEKGDDEKLIEYFAKKISGLRIFEDENGKMNLALKDVGGQVLLVSQFTLAGDCEHGNRPSFITAEEPQRAKNLYEKLGKLIENNGISVKYGVFGADMRILQENQGPVTIQLKA